LWVAQIINLLQFKDVHFNNTAWKLVVKTIFGCHKQLIMRIESAGRGVSSIKGDNESIYFINRIIGCNSL
jgi:hypothetical protein